MAPQEEEQSITQMSSGASMACQMMPQLPTVYYVCQPVSTYIFFPSQAQQPGLEFRVQQDEAPADHTQLSGSASAGTVPHLDQHCQDMKDSSFDESSVGRSTCSTAPSARRRPRKTRARPAQRQAAAERQRLALDRAQRILQEKVEFTCKLKGNSQARKGAIKELKEAIWPLSVDKDGCRLVQLAIERACGPERADVVVGLRGHVREAMGSLHANHVIQKVVSDMPLDVASFIASELSGIAAEVCRHRYACRILCRLIEQFGSSACVSSLIEEMMVEIDSLLQHNFGRYVVQAVLEHGLMTHRHAIAQAVLKDIWLHATSRNGSHILESIFRYCSDSDVGMLVGRIVPERVLELSQDRFGIFVVRALLDKPGSLSDRVASQLSTAPQDVKENQNYHRLLRRMKADEEDDDDEEDDEYMAGSVI